MAAPSPFGRRTRASRCRCADSVRIGDLQYTWPGNRCRLELGTEHFDHVTASAWLQTRPVHVQVTFNHHSHTSPPFLVVFPSPLALPQTLLPMPRGSLPHRLVLSRQQRMRRLASRALARDHMSPELHLMDYRIRFLLSYVSLSFLHLRTPTLPL